MKKSKLLDIHIQKRDYGYMLSRQKVLNTQNAVLLAVKKWNNLMKSSSVDNPTTKRRYYGRYFKNYPYHISLMPVDYLKGMVKLPEFAKLPEKSEIFTLVVKED